MDLVEFQTELAHLPGVFAHTSVTVSAGGAPCEVEGVDYGPDGVIIQAGAPLRLSLEHEPDDDDDDDDDDEAEALDYPYARSWLKFLDLGLAEGYPPCCVAFFTFVWRGLRLSQSLEMSLMGDLLPPRTARQRLVAWWARPTHEQRIAYIPCPWHRVCLPNGSASDTTNQKTSAADRGDPKCLSG
jgi:hypothetical protein